MGIIPARAGFTVAVTPPHGPCGDHPRSRGVYSDSPRTPATLSGSSPLARGLLRLSGDDAGDVGIIPARAGFTFWPCASTCPAADHPRSRGVYPSSTASGASRTGSSPLARGLRASRLRGLIVGRIIPARAGFTGPHGRSCRRRGDHPRSRGVYYRHLRHPLGDPGSSPLARGLPSAAAASLSSVGIIPARAGFTRTGPGNRSRSPDHPRSRGVYFDFFRSDIHSGGSSPLARGLQGGPALCWAGTRIIPARAGFTSSRAHSPGSQRDHPRSRGVYVDSGHAHAGLVGIIPARAGFTTRRGTGMPSTSDHPRSRGVYPACLASTRAMMGSSPLARGLRARRSGQPSSRGIIPARAGFTATVRAAGLSRRDHPRSRGVYKARPPYAGRALGSSPLARGLPAWPCRPWP